MSNWSSEQVRQIVDSNKLVVFAKGTKEQPMCGFSMRAMQIMNELQKPYEVVNIFDHESIRPALVEAFGWPTTPQVFVGGELIGGSDIALEMYQNGELQKKGRRRLRRRLTCTAPNRCPGDVPYASRRCDGPVTRCTRHDPCLHNQTPDRPRVMDSSTLESSLEPARSAIENSNTR